MLKSLVNIHLLYSNCLVTVMDKEMVWLETHDSQAIHS